MNTYFALPRVPMVGPRQEFLVGYCEGKRVLHVGCVDSGLLLERYEENQHLHQRLATTCSQLWGVDIDSGGIEFLRSRGFQNLVAGDITDPATLGSLPLTSFDVVLISEVVEHLENPGLFLRALRSALADTAVEIVVTVPNAFRLATLGQMLTNRELVHPDHNFWFSYRTLLTLLKKTGWAPESVRVYSFERTSLLPGRFDLSSGGSLNESSRPSAARFSNWLRASRFARSLPRRLLVRALYRLNPFWGDGLIFTARPDPAAAG